MTEELLPLCECGCGEHVTKPENKFINGHSFRGKKHSIETIKKISVGISKALTGRHLSDEHCAAMSRSQKGIPKSDEFKRVMSEVALRERNPLPDGWDSLNLTTNKNCAHYLGGIAERLLSKIFKDVQVMPRNNHGFDIICNHDKKIDIKSCATGYKGFWSFDINKNIIADYFLLIAFESREDLTPVHLWLIPGKVLNKFTGVTISKSTLHKWDQYEQPLDKTIMCCNEMKSEIGDMI